MATITMSAVVRNGKSSMEWINKSATQIDPARAYATSRKFGLAVRQL
jgi:hypothetical protein